MYAIHSKTNVLFNTTPTYSVFFLYAGRSNVCLLIQKRRLTQKGKLCAEAEMDLRKWVAHF